MGKHQYTWEDKDGGIYISSDDIVETEIDGNIVYTGNAVELLNHFETSKNLCYKELDSRGYGGSPDYYDVISISDRDDFKKKAFELTVASFKSGNTYSTVFTALYKLVELALFEAEIEITLG